MKETDLNSIITKNFNQIKQFAYKIPDPSKGIATSASKRPFDIFAVTVKDVFCIEVKLMKNKVIAFAFNKVEPHQFWYLRLIRNLNLDVYSLVILGVWISRKPIQLLVFDIDYLQRRQATGEKSIKQKEMLELLSSKAITMDKKIFDPLTIKDYIIK